MFEMFNSSVVTWNSVVGLLRATCDGITFYIGSYKSNTLLSLSHCSPWREAVSQSSPLLLSNSNPVWSWKVSIRRCLCRLSADLLSSSSMLWISQYDAWWYVRGVRWDLGGAADTGDPAGLVNWELQSAGSTCQGIKMDGGDLHSGQRMEHNLAQMLNDSGPSDWLVILACVLMLFAATLWFNSRPHDRHAPGMTHRTPFVFSHSDSLKYSYKIKCEQVYFP